jgi:ATP-dependent Lon protease
MDGKPVEWYSEVFNVVFPNIDKDGAASRWKSQLTKPAKEDGDKSKENDE